MFVCVCVCACVRACLRAWHHFHCCIALHCIALHCVALRCIALHCIALQAQKEELEKALLEEERKEQAEAGTMVQVLYVNATDLLTPTCWCCFRVLLFLCVR
jgi:hypothetical protein